MQNMQISRPRPNAPAWRTANDCAYRSTNKSCVYTTRGLWHGSSTQDHQVNNGGNVSPIKNGKSAAALYATQQHTEALKHYLKQFPSHGVLGLATNEEKIHSTVASQ